MRCVGRWAQPTLLVWAVALLHSGAKAEEVRVGTREELVAALASAKAGATILVAPGVYRGGVSQARLRGTAERPIVIAGADATQPPVFEGGGGGLQFSSPEHLELRDLVIAGASGNGLNIDDGGSREMPARHVVLRNLVVRDVGPEGNRDGMKLSGVDDFRVEGCRVQRWGSGGSAIDMVGCHRGTIAGCTFVDARGEGANGVQTKGGSSQIVIKGCRFQDAGGRGVNAGGSTGLAYFRPADADFEAKDITIEDCEFIRGQAAVAFVGVDGAVVRRNTIYRPGRWPFRILQENQDARFAMCRQGRVLDNVIAFRSDEVRDTINIGGKTSPETFEFAGNQWYCLDQPGDTRRLVRLPVGETNGVYDRDPKIVEGEKGDVRIPARE